MEVTGQNRVLGEKLLPVILPNTYPTKEGLGSNPRVSDDTNYLGHVTTPLSSQVDT